MNLLAQLRARRPPLRVLYYALAVVIVVGIGWGGWALWKGRYEAQGALALAQARILVGQAQAPTAAADAGERAEKALQGVIADYPHLSSIAQAAYLLGGIRFSAGQYAKARESYDLARAKAASRSSLATLAALDVGYCWEAEKKYGEAEKAYQSVINGAKPKDFLYEEAMVDMARAQELGGKQAAAIETYSRVLKDVPDTRRADELRARLASLQPAAKP